MRSVGFIKTGQNKGTNCKLWPRIIYPFIYLFILCRDAFWGKKGEKKHPKIRPQSESVMSALTIIQDVRHGTLVHIYSFLLPGKHAMEIKVLAYINILIVMSRKFKYSLKNINSIQMKTRGAVRNEGFLTLSAQAGRTVTHLISKVGLWGSSGN